MEIEKGEREERKKKILSGYRLKVNYLPSKQEIWVRFPLSAMAKKTN